MKIGLFMSFFRGEELDAALDGAKEAGVDCVEIGSGNLPRSAHCDLDELLASESERRSFLSAIESRGLEISGLSCHGNPLHPRSEIAQPDIEVQRKTVQLAEKLGVDCVNLFSGCPGENSTDARHPNWVASAFPGELRELLDWQWREKVIPYWKEEAEFASRHGVRLCLEPHPGTVVFNPVALLRLREACGEALGANLDPSHFYWQQIDIEAAIAAMGDAGAIFHCHAKDIVLEKPAALKGVLETLPDMPAEARSWNFRLPGNGDLNWSSIVGGLRKAGYDGALSIEHEDPYSPDVEVLARAVNYLRSVVDETA